MINKLLLRRQSRFAMVTSFFQVPVGGAPVCWINVVWRNQRAFAFWHDRRLPGKEGDIRFPYERRKDMQIAPHYKTNMQFGQLMRTTVTLAKLLHGAAGAAVDPKMETNKKKLRKQALLIFLTAHQWTVLTVTTTQQDDWCPLKAAVCIEWLRWKQQVWTRKYWPDQVPHR